MLRRRITESRAFLRSLLGGGLPQSGTTAAIAPSPPVQHFLKRLLGGAAPVSRDLSARAASSKEGGGGGGGGSGGGQASLTVHFLRHSCGLAEADAAAAAARVRLRDTKNAHAVLARLRALSMPSASIARLVAACPAVLSSTTLAAKIDFYLHELGLSAAEVRRFLLATPNRFTAAGLDGRLRPNRLRLRAILGSDQNVLIAVKQSIDLIYNNLEVMLLPKLQALRDYGVTEEVLVKLVTVHPKALVHRAARFDEGLVAMKDLGISPKSGIFPYAFGVFAKMFQEKWDRRMKNYFALGWTKEQVIRAFVRHPYCMSVSDKKVRQIMQFLDRKLGWSPEYVSSCPTILSLSYEKRLLPRWAVLDILVSWGVIKNGIKMNHLTISENKFVERFVTRYQEEIPQVLEAYGARTATAVK